MASTPPDENPDVDFARPPIAGHSAGPNHPPEVDLLEHSTIETISDLVRASHSAGVPF